ncbi:hypothetical protein V494_00783 [Pseudogymnoascus sp. VKM F-4513 (FW-928)]|nr:hypothetical protein V494_00783 [Pseudogymnoascus sp. VKM F-4513 (FW-928)]
MTRKRTRHTTKPENRPPVDSTSNGETQIESLATFLDTSSPVHEPIQLPGFPEPMSTSKDGDMLQCLGNMRSEVDRVRSQVLMNPFQSTNRDKAILLREPQGEETALKKGMTARMRALEARTRMGLDGAQKPSVFEKQSSSEPSLLDDLKQKIESLAGHISMDEHRKLQTKLQEIAEQIKVTALDTKVYLSHPDGSPNENAFEQEAAVQKILLNISDLEMNIKLCTGVNNPKVSEKIDEPIEQGENVEDAIPKTEPLKIRSGQSYDAISMPPMDTQIRELAANAIHSPPRVRDAIADSTSVSQLDVKADSKQQAIRGVGMAGGENSVTAKTAPLPIAKKLLYADISHPKEILELWITFWNGDKSVRGTLSEYLTHFPQSIRDETWDTHMNWLYGRAPGSRWTPNTRGDTAARQAEKAGPPQTQEPVVKPGMDMSLDSQKRFIKKLEELGVPVQGQEINTSGVRLGDRLRRDPIRNTWEKVRPEGDDERVYAGGAESSKAPFVKLVDDDTQQQNLESETTPRPYPQRTKRVLWRLSKLQERLQELELEQHKADGILEMRAASLKTKEMKETLKPLEDDAKKVEKQIQEAGKFLGSNMQHQETEALLNQRENYLHKLEKQQIAIDELRFLRERDIVRRENDWEKRKEEQLDIDWSLDRRDERSQKRDNQLFARESMLHDHEDRFLRREDQLLFRERQVDRRERRAEARIAALDKQAADLQAQIRDGLTKLGNLSNSRELVRREIAAQGAELDERALAIDSREAAVASREKLAELRMDQRNRVPTGDWTYMPGPAVKAGATVGNWPRVLKLAVMTRVFIEEKETIWQWGPDQTDMADLKKVALEVEEEAKKVLSNRPVKGGDFEAGSTAVKASEKKISPAPMQAKKAFIPTDGWNGLDENVPAATPKKDGKTTTSWTTFGAKKPHYSTPSDDCTNERGCPCDSCAEIAALLPFTKSYLYNSCAKEDNNGAANPQSSPPLEECTRKSDCRCEWCLYPSEKSPVAVPSSTRNTPLTWREKEALASNRPQEGYEKLSSPTKNTPLTWREKENLTSDWSNKREEKVPSSSKWDDPDSW